MSSEFPENPWENLAIDFHGPLNNGSYLVVIIDEHSKFPVFEEVKSTATQHALTGLDETFSLIGIPKVLSQTIDHHFRAMISHSLQELCN